MKHLKQILKENERIEFVWLDWWSTPTLTLELDTTTTPAVKAARSKALASIPHFVHSCGHHWCLWATNAQKAESLSRSWIMLEVTITTKIHFVLLK